jgi:hypothetical protein
VHLLSNWDHGAIASLELSQRSCLSIQLCEVNELLRDYILLIVLRFILIYFQVGVTPPVATLTSLFAGESPEHRDRRCEMCRIFAQDLESRLHLSRERHLSQETVVPVLTDTCRRLGLDMVETYIYVRMLIVSEVIHSRPSSAGFAAQPNQRRRW